VRETKYTKWFEKLAAKSCITEVCRMSSASQFVLEGIWFTGSLLVEVWALTGPLQPLYSFLFQPFCCRFVLFYDPIYAFSCQTDLTIDRDSFDRELNCRPGLTFDCRSRYTLVYKVYKAHARSYFCKVPRSCSYKTSPNNQPSTTVLDSCYEVFGFHQTVCCALLSVIPSLVSPMSCHLIVVREFACPNESGSYVARSIKALVWSPKANRS